MKVIETTPDSLVIEDTPWFLWVFMIGMGLVTLANALTGRVDGWGATLLVGTLGAGLLWVAWRFLPFQRFTFDRASGVFTHQVRLLTGSQTWQRPLSDIRRAADEGHWSDGARLERVTLLTAEGRYPLESGFSGTSRSTVIRAINDWIGVT